MKDDVKVAKELVSVARELSALGVEVDMGVDPEAVDSLAAKFLSRLGAAKSRALRTYGIDLKPSDTVEHLAKAWATVQLSQ